MQVTPKDLKYAKSHEWAKKEADGTVTVGITDHAQHALGDIVYVELPEIGAVVAKGQETGVVESVKAASDIYAPVAGEIIDINDALSDDPEIINKDPYTQGWMFKIKPSDDSALDEMLDADAYIAFCESEDH